jgi:protein-S-isoprenylcysteine O-methyltransferase Ste14
MSTTTKPRNPTSTATGLAGIAAGLAAIALMHASPPAIADYQKTLIVLGSAIVLMVAVETIFFRQRWTPERGLAVRAVNPLNPGRIGRKLAAFWGTVAVILAVYWLLPEYAGSFYAPVRDAFVLILPALIVVSPIYVWWVDRLQHEPEDIYVQVFRAAVGQRPESWAPIANYARGWLVKAFFLPLMFVFTHNYLLGIWGQPLLPTDAGSFGPIYEYLYSFFFLCDVLIASVGYSLTLRLFDSHIRSAEPTLFGWAVCLICYPPFWTTIGSAYLTYDQDNLYWGHFLLATPWLYVPWGIAILLLVVVYVWATAAFGMRFSNLTHRGIITSGPYRWLKHPAYVSKNITWWLISMPFITTGGNWTLVLQSSLLLAGVNVIYYLRAMTEERHLSRDPVYREYQTFIAEHGLWANIKKRFGWKPAPAPSAPADTPAR